MHLEHSHIKDTQFLSYPAPPNSHLASSSFPYLSPQVQCGGSDRLQLAPQTAEVVTVLGPVVEAGHLAKTSSLGMSEGMRVTDVR